MLHQTGVDKGVQRQIVVAMHMAYCPGMSSIVVKMASCGSSIVLSRPWVECCMDTLLTKVRLAMIHSNWHRDSFAGQNLSSLVIALHCGVGRAEDMGKSFNSKEAARSASLLSHCRHVKTMHDILGCSIINQR